MLVLCLVAAWVGLARAQDPAPAPGSAQPAVAPPGQAPDAEQVAVESGVLAVIPAGQEELLSEMLGRGAALPGGCSLSAGNVNGASVVATYACAGGTVAVELVHPDYAARGAAKTDRFALTIKSGTAPDGLAEDLLARIRAREGKFEWKMLGPPPTQRMPSLIWWIAGGVLVLLGGLVALRRLRASR